jgi:YHS domain-containing protein
MSRRTFVALGAVLPALILGTGASAGSAPVYAESGMAIRGADPVAYFRGMGAVAGSISERVVWRGATWLFASSEHRELFERDPKRFAPRFGGYCAYTLSRGALAGSDPRAYEILGDRLYLLHSPEMKEAWHQDVEQNIKLAERHWRAALG